MCVWYFDVVLSLFVGRTLSQNDFQFFLCVFLFSGVSIMPLAALCPALTMLLLDGSMMTSIRDIGHSFRALEVLSLARSGLQDLDGNAFLVLCKREGGGKVRTRLRQASLIIIMLFFHSFDRYRLFDLPARTLCGWQRDLRCVESGMSPVPADRRFVLDRCGRHYRCRVFGFVTEFEHSLSPKDPSF